MKPCADSDDDGGRALSRRLGTTSTTSSSVSSPTSRTTCRSSSVLCGGAKVRRTPPSRRSPAPSSFLGIALLLGIGLLSGDRLRLLVRASAHKNPAAAAAAARAPAGSASSASSRWLPSLPTSGPALVRGREDDSRARHPSSGSSSRRPFFIGATQEAVRRIPRGGGPGADAAVDAEDDPEDGKAPGDADDGPEEDDEPLGGERPKAEQEGEGEASGGSDEGTDGAGIRGAEAATEPVEEGTSRSGEAVAEDVDDEDEGSVTASTSSSAAAEEEEKDDGVEEAPTVDASSSTHLPNDADNPLDADNDGSSSSAYVDRMELADDEGGETTPGGGFEEREAQMPPPTPSQGTTPSFAAKDTAEPQQENGEASLPETSTGTDQVDVLGSESGAAADADASGDAAASEDATASTLASASSMEVTDQMKQVLTRELRYTKEEVNSIKPDHARIAIKNRLSRPWEGMPPHWFRRDASQQVEPSSGGSPAAPAAKRKRRVAQITLSVLVGAAVVQSQVASGKIDPTEIVAVFVAFKDRIAPGSAAAGPSSRTPQLTPRPAVASAAGNKEEVDSTAFHADAGSASSASATSTSATTAPTATDPLPVNEHVNAVGEPHEHSVRPGVPSRPADESELDVTWLDKAITAVERGVQNFFRPKGKPRK